jgi:hypothetical protein
VKVDEQPHAAAAQLEIGEQLRFVERQQFPVGSGFASFQALESNRSIAVPVNAPD